MRRIYIKSVLNKLREGQWTSHTNETIQTPPFTLIRMQSLTRCNPSVLDIPGTIGFTLLPRLWLKVHIDRPECRWWSNRGWRNEDLSTRLRRWLIRGVTFHPRFSNYQIMLRKLLAQQFSLSKTLNVVDTMVLSDDYPNAPRVASSGRRKWSSRFTGFLRRQHLTNDATTLMISFRSLHIRFSSHID